MSTALASVICCLSHAQNRAPSNHPGHACPNHLKREAFCSLNQRPEASDAGDDPVAAAFRTALPIMLHTAFVSGTCSPEVQPCNTNVWNLLISS